MALRDTRATAVSPSRSAVRRLVGSDDCGPRGCRSARRPCRTSPTPMKARRSRSCASLASCARRRVRADPRPQRLRQEHLLQLLNGTIPHTLKGRLEGRRGVCGKSLPTKVANFATEVGMVFQDPDAQIINTRVRDEVCFGLENLCRPARDPGAPDRSAHFRRPGRFRRPLDFRPLGRAEAARQHRGGARRPPAPARARRAHCQPRSGRHGGGLRRARTAQPGISAPPS